MLLAVSNNVTSRCVFGRRSKVKNVKSTFGELSRRMLMQFTVFSFGDFFPYLGWIDYLIGIIASLKASLRALDALLDQVIKEHKILNVNDDKEDFVHILLKLQKKGILEILLKTTSKESYWYLFSLVVKIKVK